MNCGAQWGCLDSLFLVCSVTYLDESIQYINYNSIRMLVQSIPVQLKKHSPYLDDKSQFYYPAFQWWSRDYNIQKISDPSIVEFRKFRDGNYYYLYVRSSSSFGARGSFLSLEVGNQMHPKHTFRGCGEDMRSAEMSGQQSISLYQGQSDGWQVLGPGRSFWLVTRSLRVSSLTFTVYSVVYLSITVGSSLIREDTTQPWLWKKIDNL